MKINSKITISRNSKGVVGITIMDEASRARFFDGEMTMEDFANAITGLSNAPIKGTVRGLSVVGKTRIQERRSIICPLDGYNREEFKEWLLENGKEDGWEIDAYLGSRDSIGRRDGKTLLNYSVFRYEEQPTTPASDEDN